MMKSLPLIQISGMLTGMQTWMGTARAAMQHIAYYGMPMVYLLVLKRYMEKQHDPCIQQQISATGAALDWLQQQSVLIQNLLARS